MAKKFKGFCQKEAARRESGVYAVIFDNPPGSPRENMVVLTERRGDDLLEYINQLIDELPAGTKYRGIFKPSRAELREMMTECAEIRSISNNR